jgi:ABC-type amino acid transport substrate-binding protein
VEDEIMKRRFVFLFFCIILTGLSAQGREYTVGVGDYDYYPLFRYENGDFKGYAGELLNAFAKAGGYKFVYKAYPIKRLDNEYLVTKTLDLRFPDNAYWNSEAKKGLTLVYTEPALEFVEGLMVLPANKGRALASVKNIGSIAGFTVWPYLDQIKSGKLVLTENSDFTALLKMGQAGRVDGVYANIVLARYTLKETMKQPDSLVFDSTLPIDRGTYHVSTVKHPQLIKEFNDWIKKEKTFVDSLKKKYQIVVE